MIDFFFGEERQPLLLAFLLLFPLLAGIATWL